jgi:replication factor A2
VNVARLSQDKSKWGDGSLYPCRVAQCKAASQDSAEAPFFLYGHQLSRVVLVGRVHARSEQTTNFNVLLEDGSGSIDVSYYSAEEDDKSMLAPIQ